MSNRHTFRRFSLSALVAIIGLSISMLTFAQEAEEVTHEAGGTATVVIEQKNLSNEAMLGSWTLLSPLTEGSSGSLSTQTLSVPAGSFTLFSAAPEGARTTMRLYRGSEEIQVQQRPQMTFKIANGETLRAVIFYNLTRTGTVSVQSDPAGLTFTLVGPNDMKVEGTTPAQFDDAPIGNYSVRYGSLDGCVIPAPQSQKLIIDGRASFGVTMSCKAADKLRSRAEKKSDNNVTVSMDGQDVQFRDVPQNSWFASFVFNAARKNVLAGYKDELGNPSGEFGPSNNVTIAELAKVAHKLAGLSEDAFVGVNPQNPNALLQWFTPFIASAESRGWTIYNDATIDPVRPATRAEVVVTLLQVMNVPLRWQTGAQFTDVTVRTPYASAIETAAADHIIDGRTDESGKSLNLFAPNDPINRAEIAKIIDTIFTVYMGQEEEK